VRYCPRRLASPLWASCFDEYAQEALICCFTCEWGLRCLPSSLVLKGLKLREVLGEVENHLDEPALVRVLIEAVDGQLQLVTATDNLLTPLLKSHFHVAAVSRSDVSPEHLLFAVNLAPSSVLRANGPALWIDDVFLSQCPRQLLGALCYE